MKERVRFAPLVGAFDWSRPAHPLFTPACQKRFGLLSEQN